MQINIKNALISVSDKSQLLKLSNALEKWGTQMISTGGTAKALKDAKKKSGYC